MHEVLSTYKYKEKNIQKVLDNMHIGTGADAFRHKSSISFYFIFISVFFFIGKWEDVLKAPKLKGECKLIDLKVQKIQRRNTKRSSFQNLSRQKWYKKGKNNRAWTNNRGWNLKAAPCEDWLCLSILWPI